MPYSRAIRDVRATPVGKGREGVVVAWAKSVADTGLTSPLKILFGGPTIEPVDVIAYCKTRRARNLLRSNELTDLSRLIDLSVRDLWNIRQCGHESVVDILSAVILALADYEASVDDGGEAGELVDEEPQRHLGVTMSPAELIQEWVGSLNERQLTVLEHRVVTRERTLEDIGRDFGVSRERIRQIETALTTQIKSRLAASAACEQLKRQVCNAAGTVTRENRLIDALPDLELHLSNTHLRVIDLLPVLVGVEREHGWVANRSLADLRDETFRLAVGGGEQPVNPEVLEAHRLELRLSADEWSNWLDYCGLRRVGRAAVRQGATIPELAVAALYEAQHPLTSEEIATAVGASSARSLRGRLQEDERFVRVGPNSYALPEWGLETYEGIREEIAQRIERSGGRARLSSVIDELVEQFGVSASSVHAYASEPEFIRQDGWIFLANGDGPQAPRRSARTVAPAETRRCFYRDGYWWFRIDVGRDALRGSGFVVPRGVMSVFQVAQGTERTFAASEHDVRMSWTRPQPSFGSIGPLLRQLGAREGDVLWLSPTNEGELRIRLVRGWVSNEADRIALRCGVARGVEGDGLRLSVAQSLGLSLDTGWSGIVQTLRSRGDLDLADIVESYAPDGQRDNAPPSLEDFFEALRGR